MLDVSGIRANPLAAINTPGRGGEAAGWLGGGGVECACVGMGRCCVSVDKTK